jgi:aryl-alcohol dehydrogenase-like predicted oxidoreductase
MSSRLRFRPSPVTLGSAQLGMTYGIANVSGQPTEAEAFHIFDRAVELGVTTIDTARAYGTAEQLIGKWLASRKPIGVHVVTKVPKVPEGPGATRKRFVGEQIAASKAALGVERLALVLVHEETDLLDVAIVEGFESALADGSIDAYGASVYDVAVAARLIATLPIAALQIPANIADRRFERAGIIDAASTFGITVFVRSVFLQGVLLMKPEQLPGHLSAFAPFLNTLSDVAARTGQSVTELLAAGVRDIPGVTSLVFGVDAVSQLELDVMAMSGRPLPSTILDQIAQSASGLPQVILDPTKWKSSTAASDS